MKLDSKAVVTIWSADAEGAAHEPPTSIIMKGQKWFTSDQIVTILSNNSGEVSLLGAKYLQTLGFL